MSNNFHTKFSPYKNDPSKIIKTASLPDSFSLDDGRFFMGEYSMRASDMCEENQKLILERATRRYTGEFTPEWAAGRAEYECRKSYATDKEWLENSFFQVSKSGKLHQYFRTWVTILPEKT